MTTTGNEVEHLFSWSRVKREQGNDFQTLSLRSLKREHGEVEFVSSRSAKRRHGQRLPGDKVVDLTDN
jgi:hypothetical protein